MSNSYPQPSVTDEINLNQLLRALQRRWIFLLSGVVLGGTVASWDNYRAKPVWEGSFEIVVASDNKIGSSSGISGGNLLLANLVGIANGGNSNELATQLKILQSPSVLKPVFEKVRVRKAAGGDGTSLKFKKWIHNLTVTLGKGTTVMSISYRDTQKSSIVPVLNDISKTYRAYSTQERNESLKNGIKFAEEQALIYRERTSASFRALNTFGMTYGISSSGRGPSSGVNLPRLLGSNSLATAGSPFNITGGTAPLSFPNKGDSLGELAQLNQELIRRQQTFTERDPSVIALRNERDAVRRHIETSALGNVAYPGTKPISKEQAQNLVLRFQELERQASLDQSTLESMESALLSLRLEQARTTKPWELISTPTVLEQPVSPRSSRNLAIGLASGLVLGACTGLLVDRMNGKIFDKDSISKQLPCPLLADLTVANSNELNNTLYALKKYYFPGEHLAILPLGTLSIAARERLTYIFKTLGFANVKLCRSIIDAETSRQVLIVAECGSVTNQDVSALADLLKLQTDLTTGWIWVSQVIRPS